jgi:hypothetical protein
MPLKNIELKNLMSQDSCKIRHCFHVESFSPQNIPLIFLPIRAELQPRETTFGDNRSHKYKGLYIETRAIPDVGLMALGNS